MGQVVNKIGILINEKLIMYLRDRDRRRHRGPTHFLSGMKNVVRRLLGLWKLKNNVMLILNAMILLVF